MVFISLYEAIFRPILIIDKVLNILRVWNEAG